MPRRHRTSIRQRLAQLSRPFFTRQDAQGQKATDGFTLKEMTVDMRVEIQDVEGRGYCHGCSAGGHEVVRLTVRQALRAANVHLRLEHMNVGVCFICLPGLLRSLAQKQTVDLLS